MFKNLILYRITALPTNALGADACFDNHAFVPCTPTQEKSTGWVPPRGAAYGPLLECIDGQWIAKLMIESRTVPKSAIERAVQAKIKNIKAATGHGPSKKETRAMMEEEKQRLLPQAFPKESAVLVWIDPKAMLLAINASTQAKADAVMELLIGSIEGFAASLINTQIIPALAMAEWLITQEHPQSFSVDRACELTAADESDSKVRYTNHSLDITEVPDHIKAGKMPTRLAMTWNSRVSFVLTEGMQVKSLEFLGFGFCKTLSESGENQDFDSDVTLATGELRGLIVDLFAALGGVFDETLK